MLRKIFSYVTAPIRWIYRGLKKLWNFLTSNASDPVSPDNAAEENVPEAEVVKQHTRNIAYEIIHTVRNTPNMDPIITDELIQYRELISDSVSNDCLALTANKAIRSMGEILSNTQQRLDRNLKETDPVKAKSDFPEILSQMRWDLMNLITGMLDRRAFDPCKVAKFKDKYLITSDDYRSFPIIFRNILSSLKLRLMEKGWSNEYCSERITLDNLQTLQTRVAAFTESVVAAERKFAEYSNLIAAIANVCSTVIRSVGLVFPNIIIA